MSLLEGHGDVTMDRAGADRIPSERFSRVLRQRREHLDRGEIIVCEAGDIAWKAGERPAFDRLQPDRPR